MKETTASDVYYTQGEYVTYFDKDYISIDLDLAASIRSAAIELAEERKIPIRYKSGGGINRSRKTVLLPKSIWKESFNTETQSQ